MSGNSARSLDQAHTIRTSLPILPLHTELNATEHHLVPPLEHAIPPVVAQLPDELKGDIIHAAENSIGAPQDAEYHEPEGSSVVPEYLAH